MSDDHSGGVAHLDRYLSQISGGGGAVETQIKVNRTQEKQPRTRSNKGGRVMRYRYALHSVLLQVVDYEAHRP